MPEASPALSSTLPTTSVSSSSATNCEDPLVGVQATFFTQAPNINQPVESHTFACLTPLSQVSPIRTPPPSEEGEVPPYEPGSSSFSGRHDNGLLPPLREGGVWGQVIRAVGGAKDDSDIFLTGEIGGREREEGMEVEESEEPEEGEEGRVEGMKGEGVRAFGNVEDVAKRRVEASSCKDENEGKEAEGEAVWAVTAGRQEGGEGGEGEDQATICGLKKPKV